MNAHLLVIGAGAAVVALALRSQGAVAAPQPALDLGGGDDLAPVDFGSDVQGFTADPTFNEFAAPFVADQPAELPELQADLAPAPAPVAADPVQSLMDPADTMTATASYPFADLIEAASQRYGVRAALIAAVIQTESSFRPDARAHGTTAYGLMQMTQAAAKDVGADWNELGDPETAIDAGTHYLSRLIHKFGEADGVRAYYAGAGNVSAQLAGRGGNQVLLAQADAYLARVQSNVG